MFTACSVPVSHHSLVKQFTELFSFTARAFRSSPLLYTSRLVLHDSFVLRFRINLGGDEESRTPDPLLARQVLSQLSYTPTVLRNLGGLKWTRTTDLTLIRRAL